MSGPTTQPREPHCIFPPHRIPSSTEYETNFTLTATVTASSGATTPTGNVVFYQIWPNTSQPASTLGTVPLDSTGTATIQVPQLQSVTREVYAFYTGSSEFGQSLASLPVLDVSEISLNVNPSIYAAPGTDVTLTATVTGYTSTQISGTVNFLDGGSQIGTAAISPVSGSSYSTATFSTSSLANGMHSLSAVHIGNSDYAPSSSTPFNLEAGSLPTTTTVIGGIRH